MFIHWKDNRSLMQSPKIRIESASRLIPIDLAIEIPPFPLPEAGIYGVECYVDEALIGSVRLQVEGMEVSGKS